MGLPLREIVMTFVRNHLMITFSEEFCSQNVRDRFTTAYPVAESLKKQLVCLHQHPFLFDASDFQVYSIQELFNYLKSSHIYYLDYWLPKIDQTLQLLRHKSQSSLTVNLLSLFLDKYTVELDKHIRHEEQVLLRFVEEMLQGNFNEERKNFVLRHFLFTHNDHIILHLEQLKEDMVKLEIDLKSNLIFSVLFNQLQILQADLEIHSRIEDDVFIPKLLEFINAGFGERGWVIS